MDRIRLLCLSAATGKLLEDVMSSAEVGVVKAEATATRQVWKLGFLRSLSESWLVYSVRGCLLSLARRD